MCKVENRQWQMVLENCRSVVAFCSVFIWVPSLRAVGAVNLNSFFLLFIFDFFLFGGLLVFCLGRPQRGYWNVYAFFHIVSLLQSPTELKWKWPHIFTYMPFHITHFYYAILHILVRALCYSFYFLFLLSLTEINNNCKPSCKDKNGQRQESIII